MHFVSCSTGPYGLLGASPQTPWVGFTEFSGGDIFCKAEQRLFLLLFLEKEHP
jgi:hypothetical protein